jgi:hypothetical protein
VLEPEGIVATDEARECEDAGRGQGQGGVSGAASRPRSIGQWEAGSRRVEKLEYCASCVIDLVAGVGVRELAIREFV